jgi:hypothetical protein
MVFYYTICMGWTFSIRSKFKPKMKVMKNIFMVSVVIILFAACKGKSNNTVVLADSSNLVKKEAVRPVTRYKVVEEPVRRAPVQDNSTVTSPTTAATPEDKGWSEAAKGATVGGGSGAIIGAVVNKNRPEGAIIGSVIGAGTGYMIGRSMDRKSGRVARQKARARAKKRAHS